MAAPSGFRALWLARWIDVKHDRGDLAPVGTVRIGIQ